MLAARLFAAAAPILTFDPVVRTRRPIVLATLRRGTRRSRMRLVRYVPGKAISLSLLLGGAASVLGRVSGMPALEAFGGAMLAHKLASMGAGFARRIESRKDGAR